MAGHRMTPDTNVKKRGLRFYLKVIVTFILLLAASAGIAVYYVYYQLTSDSRFEKIIMTRVSEALKMDVKLEKFDVAFPGFALLNVAVATDSPEMKLQALVDRIDVTPDFFAAFNGQLVFDSLSIGSSTIFLENRKPLLTASKTEVGKSSAGTVDLTGVVFPFNSLDVDRVNLDFSDLNSGFRQNIILSRAEIEKSFISSALPYRFSISTEDYGKLTAHGKIYWPDTLTTSIVYSGLKLDKLAEFLPEAYRDILAKFSQPELLVEAAYKMSGELLVSNAGLKFEPNIKINGEAAFAKFSPLTGSASLRLASIDFQNFSELAGNLMPDLPIKVDRGAVSADLSIGISSGSISEIKVNANPRDFLIGHNMLGEKIVLSRGSIQYDGSSVNIADLSASFAKSSIKMQTGKVSFNPLDFNGKLKINADLEKIWSAIDKVLPESAKRFSAVGSADFAGGVDYKNSAVTISGDLNSSKIVLKEKFSRAEATIDTLKVSFDKLGANSGTLIINSLLLQAAGGKIAASGRIANSQDPGFDLKSEGTVNLGEFSAIAGSVFKLPIQKDQFAGNIDLNIKLGGRLSDLKPSGTITLKSIKADLPDQGLLVKNINGSAFADLSMLKVEKLSGELVDGKLELAGSLENFKSPVVSGQVSLINADVDKVRVFIRKNFPDMPSELEVGGRADLSFNISGKIAQPKIGGIATLKAVRFFHPAVLRPIENISGPVTIDNNGLKTTKLEARWGTSAIELSGSLKDWGKLMTDFSYSVKPLDATDAAGFFLKDYGYKFQGIGSGTGKITGAVEKIVVTGQAEIPEGIFSAPISKANKDEFKFPFTKLAATFKYFNKVFEIQKADFDIFSGKVSASGKVFLDKEPIAFEFVTNLSQVETSAFLRQNTKFGNVLKGGLDGKADIKGNANGLASVNGLASLSMPKGSYNSPPVIRNICEQLNASHLASGTIENVSGDYTISAGRISSKNTMARSKYGKMVFIGSVGLDTSLDGTMNLEIVRSACLQSQVLKQLIGDEEYLKVPVTLKGSLISPSVSIPLDRMLKDVAQKKVKSSLEKTAKEALGKIFGKEKPKEQSDQQAQPNQPVTNQTSPAPAPEEKPVKKLENKIKDIGKDLKKIFKF
ncbi:MAG: hypothetical protein Kow0029_28900 [Candidatus Rifleibacteriota bacterium]